MNDNEQRAADREDEQTPRWLLLKDTFDPYKNEEMEP